MLLRNGIFATVRPIYGDQLAGLLSMDRQELREIGRRADMVGQDRELRRSVRPQAKPLVTPQATAVMLMALGVVALFLTLS